MKLIKWVGCLEGGNLLDIHLSSGENILLSTLTLRKKEGFNCLEDRLLRPLTDGEVIYWENGPKLSYEEILKLLREGEHD